MPLVPHEQLKGIRWKRHRRTGHDIHFDKTGSEVSHSNHKGKITTLTLLSPDRNSTKFGNTENMKATR